MSGVEIVIGEDGENTPRKELLRAFNVAFIEGDVEKTLSYVTDDITWDLIGEGTIEGREGMKAWLESMAGKTARRVELEQIITQGRSAAINGSYEMASGSKFAFCDIYEFSGDDDSSPISNYSSYVIRL